MINLVCQSAHRCFLRQRSGRRLPEHCSQTVRSHPRACEKQKWEVVSLEIYGTETRIVQREKPTVHKRREEKTQERREKGAEKFNTPCRRSHSHSTKYIQYRLYVRVPLVLVRTCIVAVMMMRCDASGTRTVRVRTSTTPLLYYYFVLS